MSARDLLLSKRIPGNPIDQQAAARRALSELANREVIVPQLSGIASDFGVVNAGTIVLADKAYDADRIRASLREKGAFANIPPKANRRSKPYFSTWLYRERNLIERFFSKLKHFRRVATRYDKLAENFLAMVQLASMRLWLRVYESTA